MAGGARGGEGFPNAPALPVTLQVESPESGAVDGAQRGAGAQRQRS